jgi:hypothetical protein
MNRGGSTSNKKKPANKSNLQLHSPTKTGKAKNIESE